jgi:hypothetical protein
LISRRRVRETLAVSVPAAGPNVELLKLIQAVITRMAGNSFLLKGWAVTLVTGLAALAKADGNQDVAWISCGVLAVFALLDAYYLALERAFRKLYDDKAASTADGDWSLKLGSHAPGAGTVLKTLRSFAIWPVYGIALAGSLLVATNVV